MADDYQAVAIAERVEAMSKELEELRAWIVLNSGYAYGSPARIDSDKVVGRIDELLARDVSMKSGNSFTCPRCGCNWYRTNMKGGIANMNDWIVECKNDRCKWTGRHADYVRKPDDVARGPQPQAEPVKYPIPCADGDTWPPQAELPEELARYWSLEPSNKSGPLHDRILLDIARKQTREEIAAAKIDTRWSNPRHELDEGMVNVDEIAATLRILPGDS